MNLQHLISQLLKCYQPVAESQNSFFVNSIPADIFVDTDAGALTLTAISLLYVVARRSHESLITIDAGAHDHITTLTITDSNNTNSYGVLYEFQHLKLLSKRTGGVLDIYRTTKGTTISFSFINNAGADTAVIKELKAAC